MHSEEEGRKVRDGSPRGSGETAEGRLEQLEGGVGSEVGSGVGVGDIVFLHSSSVEAELQLLAQ